jgi:hypothetical protein
LLAHATTGGQQSIVHPSYYAEICIGSDPVRTTLNLSDDLLTEAKALRSKVLKLILKSQKSFRER